MLCVNAISTVAVIHNKSVGGSYIVSAAAGRPMNIEGRWKCEERKLQERKVQENGPIFRRQENARNGKHEKGRCNEIGNGI